MTIFRPLPRSITRPVSALFVILWVVSMVVLVKRSYVDTSAANLATDLARYGSNAEWRGVYYRGEKIGFTVSQTVPRDGGFELQEDGRLQMALLGATTAAALHTSARVDSNFALQSFDFSLDPGTGAIVVRGRVEPLDARRSTVTGPSESGRPLGTAGEANGRARLVIAITSAGATRTETRELDQVPVLSQNFSRLLAGGRLKSGSQQRWAIFDPATLRNQPVLVEVGSREIVRNVGERPIPAFRVDMEYQGLRTTSWITDTGDVVREESPLGMITVRESADRAQTLAVPGRVQSDLLEAAAVVPSMRQHIDEPRDVRLMRLELDGADLHNPDLEGGSQTVHGSNRTSGVCSPTNALPELQRCDSKAIGCVRAASGCEPFSGEWQADGHEDRHVAPQLLPGRRPPGGRPVDDRAGGGRRRGRARLVVRRRSPRHRAGALLPELGHPRPAVGRVGRPAGRRPLPASGLEPGAGGGAGRHPGHAGPGALRPPVRGGGRGPDGGHGGAVVRAGSGVRAPSRRDPPPAGRRGGRRGAGGADHAGAARGVDRGTRPGGPRPGRPGGRRLDLGDDEIRRHRQHWLQLSQKK
jgi:hypothetical protein